MNVAQVLDRGRQVAHLAGPELGKLLHLGGEDADLFHLVGAVRSHHEDVRSGAQGPIDDVDINNHAPVLVVDRVEDQGPKRGLALAARRRDAVDDDVEELGNAFSSLRADSMDTLRIDSKGIDHFFNDLVRPRSRHVNLVEDGHYGKASFHGQVGIGDGLSFNALGRIDEQKSPLAGCQAAGDLVAEVDMAWSVDEVEEVLSIRALVGDGDRLCLDGNAALALEVHVIEDLILEVPERDRSRPKQDAVREGGLAVVDVGNDAKIANILLSHIFPPQRSVKLPSPPGDSPAKPSARAPDGSLRSFPSGRAEPWSSPGGE